VAWGRLACDLEEFGLQHFAIEWRHDRDRSEPYYLKADFDRTARVTDVRYDERMVPWRQDDLRHGPAAVRADGADRLFRMGPLQT
jgi:hypothetical protein